MEEKDAGKNCGKNERRRQLKPDFTGNLGEDMKPNDDDDDESPSAEDAAAGVVAVESAVDGGKCDDEDDGDGPPPPSAEDDVAPDCDEGVDQGAKDPDYVEERFRVDRRKLEQLIQASEDEEENAEEFFKKIMSETKTHIAWPSKLKIGAKSKKDPHIKVSGHKDSVSEAKNLILAILDTKSLRVTLKMDVSHTEHSHVIGKSGHNIKRVMQETGCHIHFPDSNRNTLAEKSNQVSIAGQCEGVELARMRIRELLPLVFMFEVPVSGPNQAKIDSNSAVIQSIQHNYGVSIKIKTHHQVFMKTVIIRGSVYNSKSVKKAAIIVFELLTGRIGEAFGVSMLLDISPQHHLFIIGHGGSNITRIMQHTGASVQFPDPASAEQQRRGTVCITGTMSSVFLAQQQLLGCLPIVLMFDLKDDIEVDQGLLSQLMEQLDVFISIKPKPKQTTKSVIVKTIESNTQNVYEARRRILGLSQETPTCEMSCDIAALPADNFNDHQNRSRSVSSCFDTTFGVKSLQQLESLSTTVASAPLKNTGYRHMMMFPHQQPHHPDGLYAPSYASPPFCFMPPYGTQDWSAYSPNHQLSSPQLQRLHIPTSFPVSPSQRSNVRNGNDDLILHLTSSLSPPQMTPYGPSISSHNLRCLTDGVVPVHHSRPSSTLPFTTPPLPLDFLSSQLFSNMANGPPLNTNQIDMFGSVFDVKSVLQNDVQHSFPRNHLDSNSTGFSHLQPNISTGTFSSTATLSAPHSYNSDAGYSQNADAGYSHNADAGYSHSSLLYPLQTSASSSSMSTISSSPSSVLYPHSFCQQYSVHDGMFPRMPDQSNDVYSTTLITNPTLIDNNVAAQMRFHPVNGSVYATGRKQPIDDGRHDLLEETRQQTFPVQDGHAERDVDCESDGSAELNNGSKAPGSNRPKRSIDNCQFDGGSLLFSDVDYDRMKLLASKAMQKKPVGESRIPTDYWAGLGFSRSMPASAIRDRLNLNDLSYNGPKMTTPYEDVEEDSETWKATVNSDNPAVGGDSLLDFVSHLSARCQELSQQQDHAAKSVLSGTGQTGVSSSPSSSVWQPLSERKIEGSAVCCETDLCLLFGEMGLGKYVELFKQQEIDMQTFLTLTDQDLKDLGISTFGARRKMLLAIADLNKRQSLLPPPPGLPNPFRDAGIIRRHDIVSQSVRW